MKTSTHRPLTDTKIASLKPPEEGRYEVTDAGAAGLQLRVTAAGIKTFRRAVRDGGALVWVTLGEWSPTARPGFLTVNQARIWSVRLGEAARAGRVSAVRLELDKELRPSLVPRGSGERTVREVAADFMAALKRKRPEQARRPLDCDILPAIGDRLISTVGREDGRSIIKAVKSVRDGGEAPRKAAVVLAILKQLFAFAVDDGAIASNPMFSLKASTFGLGSNERQRVLSDREIGAWWRALDAYKGLTPTTRIGLKLLLLTGVRSGELLKARVDSVDFDTATLTVPVENQKLTLRAARKARAWKVPLSSTAFDLVCQLRALARSFGSDFLLASFSPANPGGALTDKALTHSMRRLFEGSAPLLSFADPRPTPHDLRRTFRSGLASIGVPHEVGERCLNHKLGGVAETYLAEVNDIAQRRDAVERWAKHVRTLIASS